MRSPFYKVHLGDVDITDKVERFVLEDSAKEDNYLNITVKSDFAKELADDDTLQTGKIITAQFGFLGLSISPVHQCRVTDIVTKYRERVTLDIKCLDLGTTVKKVTSDKIWEDKTSLEIAEEIADKYGLSVISDNPSKKWKHLPQGHRSDLTFLKYIADREEGGNWIVYIRNENLYFVKRATDKASTVTYTYGIDDSIISFEPTVKESSDSGASHDVKVATSDPSSLSSPKDISKVSINNKTETSTGTTGEWKRVYDANGNFQKTIKEAAKPSKTVSTPANTDKGEAANLGNSIKKTNTLKQVVAKLLTNGDPLAEPNTIITMANVAKRHSGNWLVTKVTHDISASGYTTARELSKNGSKEKTSKDKTGADKAKDANTTVGKNSGTVKQKTKVRTYDANGKELK